MKSLTTTGSKWPLPGDLLAQFQFRPRPRVAIDADLHYRRAYLAPAPFRSMASGRHRVESSPFYLVLTILAITTCAHYTPVALDGQVCVWRRVHFNSGANSL